MSGCFRPLPKFDFSGVREKVESMTDEEFQDVVADMESMLVTHDDRMRFIEYVEQNNGGRLSWDMPYSFEEYARRVRAGEDLSNG